MRVLRKHRDPAPKRGEQSDDRPTHGQNAELSKAIGAFEKEQDVCLVQTHRNTILEDEMRRRQNRLGEARQSSLISADRSNWVNCARNSKTPETVTRTPPTGRFALAQRAWPLRAGHRVEATGKAGILTLPCGADCRRPSITASSKSLTVTVMTSSPNAAGRWPTQSAHEFWTHRRRPSLGSVAKGTE